MSQTFYHMMEELRQDYLKSLPQKLDCIQECLDKKRLQELQREFHKLKGTGKTYGMQELSQIGEAFEFLCEKKKEDAFEWTPEAISLIKEILNCRKKGEAFSLEDDDRFLKLQNFLKNL